MKLGKFTRTVKKTNDPSNYAKDTMTGVIYGSGKYPIKKQKVVTLTNTKTGASRTKTIDYGPVTYVGSQKKTKTIVKKGKLLK